HDRIEALSLSDSVAVMKDGRIVEIGTPRQIYFDSDRRFVADFIGRVNLVEGKVSAAGDVQAVVASLFGPIVCRAQAGVSPGAAVAVCIRPEFIRILAKDPGDRPNVFRGRVASLLFMGDACEGEIRVGDTLLIARLDATTGVQAGDEVLLSVDPAHCALLSK
ncbi:MAG: TOBE domain-containing protein, partial [Candidatus Methylomirabilota bacterium]